MCVQARVRAALLWQILAASASLEGLASGTPAQPDARSPPSHPTSHPLARYFGDSASPLITTDLSTSSVYRSYSRLPVDRGLAALVLVNTLCKYPSLNLVLQVGHMQCVPLASRPARWSRQGVSQAGCMGGAAVREHMPAAAAVWMLALSSDPLP